MKTIDNEYLDQLEINKSKFLSFAYPVSDEAHAKEILNLKKLEFKDATHICFGLVLSSPRLEKCSDDGEPSGTAGKPILELIKKKPYPKIRVSEFIEKHRLTARLFTDITVYGFVICL